MKIFKLRENWFTEDEFGRRNKFKTEAEAMSFAGFTYDEPEDDFEPTELDEWLDYDPDC